MLNTDQYFRNIFTTKDEVALERQTTITLFQLLVAIVLFIVGLTYGVLTLSTGDTEKRNIYSIIYIVCLIGTCVFLFFAVIKNPLKKFNVNTALFIYLNVIINKVKSNKLSFLQKSKLSILLFWVSEALVKVKYHIENQFIFKTKKKKLEIISDTQDAFYILRELIKKDHSNEVVHNFLKTTINYSSITIANKVIKEPEKYSELVKVNYDQLKEVITEIKSHKSEKLVKNNVIGFFSSKVTQIITLLIVIITLIFASYQIKNPYFINTLGILGFGATILNFIWKGRNS
ncbi:hypothetical protein M6D81_11785 [Paenibacillus sp. J5C_2022]|uniref:hypothetical protein n=1 Tax=Paenibacillus sp. J5C2022 TaxID=2977129 RepID=UPI0021D05DE5|nr:hypothetical protein [Paenibacillus sp. J5C2022]MCU6709385.1 hypothetical protein [Paenibacillus sp. J5C2022]